MVASENTWMRGQESYADKTEQTASLVANALANVAAAVAIDVVDSSHLPLQQEQGQAVDQPAEVHFDVVSDVLWKIFIDS